MPPSTSSPPSSEVAPGLAAACALLARWVDGVPAREPAWAEAEQRLFRRAAAAHGVAPLLHRRVTERGWAASDATVWLAYQEAQNAARVARLGEELRAILRRFATAGVALLPLKGFHLVELLYAAPAVRPMSDLDLLVRESDVAAAETLLGELGYRRVFAGWKHGKWLPAGNGAVVDRGSEHPDNPRPVELHPRCRERILEELVELTEPLWSTARPGRLLGEPVLLPAADVLWLYLLVHATHHVLLGTFRLIQLVDLARLTARLDAAAAEERLAAVEARATLPALELLRRTFPRPGVEGWARELRQRVSPGFAAWAASLDLYRVSFLNPAPWRAG